MTKSKSLDSNGDISEEEIPQIPRPDEVHYVTNRRELVRLINKTRSLVLNLIDKKFWAAGSACEQLQYPGDEFNENVRPVEKLQVLKVTEVNRGSGRKLLEEISLKESTLPNDGIDIGEKKRAILTYLLQEKLEDSVKHLGRLLQRITDNRSKVLVTGDLNSGKSTLVNAILKRNLLPSDQQPCTLIFAEVIDSAHNNDLEEIHCIRPNVTYSHTDLSTYVRREIGDLQNLLEDNKEGFERLKLYYNDDRSTSNSILKNELIETTLIDSPGLNIDTAKTMALFAKQEEIDAIVFVVNAENHFTLSGREFLETAGKEKAYIFIAVNKFDTIKNKEKCKKMIVKQIENISPLTHKELESLVHFVSAKYRITHILGESKVNEYPEYDNYQDDFIHLEESLSSFILEKRSRSKLAPAKIYLYNLLSDLMIILKYNENRIKKVLSLHHDTVGHYLPEFHSMSEFSDQLYNVERIVEKGCLEIESVARESLKGLVDNIDSFASMAEWKSLFNYTDFGNTLFTVLQDASNYFVQDSFDEIKPTIEEYKSSIKNECIKLINTHVGSNHVRVSKLLHQLQPPNSNNLQKVAPAILKKPHIPTAGVIDEMKHIIMSELECNFKPVKFIREYSPSTSMMVLGALGSRYYIIKKSNYLNSLNRTQSNDATNIFILALITSGIAIFMYRLSNMKNNVRRKVIERVKDCIGRSVYISENVSQISSYTRSQLYYSVNTLRTTVSEIICDSETKINTSKASIAGLDSILSSIQKAISELSTITEELKNINL